MDIFKIVQTFASLTQESVLNTLSLSRSFRQCYIENTEMLPVSINPLVDAHFNQRLRETAHSRILYSLLTGSNVVKKHFIKFFLDIDVSANDITIPYPDKNRIDLTIKGKNFFLIIENKVNGAQEQKKQVDRYVDIASKIYPSKEIYVLYLNQDGYTYPSEYSLSSKVKMKLGKNFICKNYKVDILNWLYAVNRIIPFDTEQQLKSSIVVYIGYLEEYFGNSKRQIIMNNKLDKLIVEQLKLDNKSTSEKLQVIEDELENVQKLCERLEFLQEQYQEEYDEENFKEWYNKCVGIIDDKLILICQSSTEFGFDFDYRKSKFRCEVSVDEGGYYWGIKCLSQRICKNVQGKLKDIVLNSKYGFHNNEENAPEWVVSDYASESDIVERFVTLTSIIIQQPEVILCQ